MIGWNAKVWHWIAVLYLQIAGLLPETNRPQASSSGS